MIILGIETSCDETAAAVVDGKAGKVKLSSSVVASSSRLHEKYGGVVPEIASRSHIEYIIPVINEALSQADTKLEDIDAIAVTQGPGLEGSLLVGLLTARTLAISHNKPLYGVNHVLAHIYAAFITAAAPPVSTNYELPTTEPRFPILVLIVSGGHTMLALFEGHLKYRVLGQTLDDAAGEAFDKVAKILGLGYPGGPSIEKESKRGNEQAFAFTEAKLQNPYDFSYSGLKTAVLRKAQALAGKDYSFPSHKLAGVLTERQKADLAASFQRSALLTLVNRLSLAANELQPASVIIAGGVAASNSLRELAKERLTQEVTIPDIKLCTDNAAMIAALGCFKVNYGHKPANPDNLSVAPGLRM